MKILVILSILAHITIFSLIGILNQDLIFNIDLVLTLFFIVENSLKYLVLGFGGKSED